EINALQASTVTCPEMSLQIRNCSVQMFSWALNIEADKIDATIAVAKMTHDKPKCTPFKVSLPTRQIGRRSWRPTPLPPRCRHHQARHNPTASSQGRERTATWAWCCCVSRRHRNRP